MHSGATLTGVLDALQVQRKKTARLALEDDVHAPDKYRVNGPLTQYKEFADAYQCTDKAIMAPPNRCGQGYGPVW